MHKSKLGSSWTNGSRKADTMSIRVKCAAVAAVALASAALSSKAETWAFNIPKTFPYDVKPSAIVPAWDATNPGEWTFNYEGAMAKAKAEGKYTLLLFTGMWWCPHCQAMEENALVKDGFKQYVAENGYYLAALDFPYRDGHSNWCWLWDPEYRNANGIGGWTQEQIADEIAKRFEFQELMHTEGGAVTTNNNVTVEITGSTTNLVTYDANPTTVYRRVGYPTIIVIDPEGNDIGRFGYSFRTIDPAQALDYVINNIEIIKAKKGSGRNELFADAGAGAVDGAAAQVYDAVLMDAFGTPVGTATIKTAKKAKDGSIKVSATVKAGGGKSIALKGSLSGAEGESAVLAKSGTAYEASVQFGAEGVAGVYTDGTSNYLVQGARNPFKGKDAAAKARAATLPKGFWTFALENKSGSSEALGRGYSAFSVSSGSKGKFKVAGVLGDGSGVTLTTQALLGEGGKLLVPVLGKKGEYAAMMVVEGGNLSEVRGVSGWKSKKASGEWSAKAISAAGQGAGAVPEIMYLQLGDFKAEDGVAGLPVAITPVDDTILASGGKWTGTKGITDLKVTFKPKNGTFSGSFNIYVQKEGSSRPTKKSVKVSGVVVDGVPYGAAVSGKAASWSFKLAGACGGGC